MWSLREETEPPSRKATARFAVKPGFMKARKTGKKGRGGENMHSPVKGKRLHFYNDKTAIEDKIEGHFPGGLYVP